jgi:hypothetical protein
MMTTTTLHPLAADYLDRIDRAARRLPRGERRELVEEISAHLHEATSLDMPDAEALTVLDRLGDPDEIVEAQLPEATRRPDRRGTHEWAAIFLLLFGGFIFVFGWIAGVILLWSSRAWNTRDKVIGTLIVPGGLASALIVGFLTGTKRKCTSGLGRPTICTPGPSTAHSIIAVLLFGLCVIGPIFTSLYLARRAR